MEDVMCDHSCSPYAKEDPLGTWRWMQHVLPQLRNKQVSINQTCIASSLITLDFTTT